MAFRLPEGCPARLVFAMLTNNFFQIPARGRDFDSAAPQVFPTECQ
jgi:hypothetical protein